MVRLSECDGLFVYEGDALADGVDDGNADSLGLCVEDGALLGEPEDETVTDGINAIETILMHRLSASAIKAYPNMSKQTSRGLENVLFHEYSLIMGLVEPLPASVLVNPDGVTARITLFPVSATAITPSTGDTEIPCGASNLTKSRPSR